MRVLEWRTRMGSSACMLMLNQLEGDQSSHKKLKHILYVNSLIYRKFLGGKACESLKFIVPCVEPSGKKQFMVHLWWEYHVQNKPVWKHNKERIVCIILRMYCLLLLAQADILPSLMSKITDDTLEISTLDLIRPGPHVSKISLITTIRQTIYQYWHGNVCLRRNPFSLFAHIIYPYIQIYKPYNIYMYI